MDETEKVITKEALRLHAGESIFCEGCSKVLDAARSVEVDFYKGDKLVQTNICCADCYDKRVAPVVAQIRKVRLEHGVTMKVIDGRELFADEAPPGPNGSRDEPPGLLPSHRDET